MGGFQGHYLAQPPEDGARKLSFPFSFQHLRAARDEPDSLGRDRTGFGQALDKSQCTRSRPAHVFHHLCGGCPISVAVQGGQVHHSAEGDVSG